MTESTTVFRRYTDLASLLDMLRRGAITLLRPDTWDDRNDRLMMKTYADCLELKTLLALCLTSRGETYHHWKVFTDPRWPGQIPPPLATPNSPRQDDQIMTTRV